MKSFYIKKPHFIGFDKNGLHYIDVLTYLTIRSFNNYRDNECFPSYETIADRMGASRSLVISSVKRLVKSRQLIKYRRYDNSNLYLFPDVDFVDNIPVEVLTLELTIYEKAMLVILRQCCVGTRVNIPGSIQNMANKLGLSYKTIYTQTKSLIEKGYVIELASLVKEKISGYKLTDKIDWTYNTDANANHSSVPDKVADDVLFVFKKNGTMCII